MTFIFELFAVAFVLTFIITGAMVLVLALFNLAPRPLWMINWLKRKSEKKTTDK